MTVFGPKKKERKKSGAAGTRTHGRGSVPLMSKLDAIPLRHEAETMSGVWGSNFSLRM